MASSAEEDQHAGGLVRPTEYDIRDSNVELVNSELDHKVKHNSAATEPAWRAGGVGAESGLYVWRIEKFTPVLVPKAKHGHFFEGDSYIVLHSHRGAPTTTNTTTTNNNNIDETAAKKKLVHDIFFWLGAHTTQDEAGTAAYKTVELDEFLHGAATQHRELQAAPSDEFVALFPRLTVRRGGVASGFHHVDALSLKDKKGDGERLVLLRVFRHPPAAAVAGRGGPGSAVVVHEVEPTWRSLDEGDVFILDQGNHVSVWQGRRCSPIEKAKAAQIVHDMTDGRRVKVNVEVLSQTESRARAVLKALGASDDDIAAAADAFHAPRPMRTSAAATAPLAAGSEPPRKRSRKLFRLSDASGQLEFRLVGDDGVEGGETISREDLVGDDVFLLDDAGKTIWVWEGSRASTAEKAMWLRVAQAYVRKLQQGEDGAAAGDVYLTPIAKVREGNESAAFLRAVQVV
ncbi:hypothetical protein B0T26DRAFT_832921 [Lasiosphaeria miniovina]|uniref:Gelsolin-like domain-containing protein n=1 Tax=Lasiosphaeria miniovina TaxID=1954250 RepID=A0AA40ACT4_9PEZI|nr:uncharacterized protein B0T26DRAFT_832921 [Lasiosphaeria miniovina]KAK0713394.1 hypothetical protein B0T26DRAFT_832921 [Lasiosphaeria miniovina]